MSVFCQFFKWTPADVRASMVGDLDLLWRVTVFERVSGD